MIGLSIRMHMAMVLLSTAIHLLGEDGSRLLGEDGSLLIL